MDLNFKTIKASTDPALATTGQQLEEAFNRNFGSVGNALTVLDENKAAVSHSHSYSDLTGKPAIPNVNNSTITLRQGGVAKGSFSLNRTAAQIIDLDAGGDGDSVTVTDSLVSTSATAALSANQGRILNGKIDDLIQVFETEAEAQAASAANMKSLCFY